MNTNTIKTPVGSSSTMRDCLIYGFKQNKFIPSNLALDYAEALDICAKAATSPFVKTAIISSMNSRLVKSLSIYLSTYDGTAIMAEAIVSEAMKSPKMKMSDTERNKEIIQEVVNCFGEDCKFIMIPENNHSNGQSLNVTFTYMAGISAKEFASHFNVPHEKAISMFDNSDFFDKFVDTVVRYNVTNFLLSKHGFRKNGNMYSAHPTSNYLGVTIGPVERSVSRKICFIPVNIGFNVSNETERLIAHKLLKGLDMDWISLNA